MDEFSCGMTVKKAWHLLRKTQYLSDLEWDAEFPGDPGSDTDQEPAVLEMEDKNTALSNADSSTLYLVSEVAQSGSNEEACVFVETDTGRSCTLVTDTRVSQGVDEEESLMLLKRYFHTIECVSDNKSDNEYLEENEVSIGQGSFVKEESIDMDEVSNEVKKETGSRSPSDIACCEPVKNEVTDGDIQFSQGLDEEESLMLLKRYFHAIECVSDNKSDNEYLEENEVSIGQDSFVKEESIDMDEVSNEVKKETGSRSPSDIACCEPVKNEVTDGDIQFSPGVDEEESLMLLKRYFHAIECVSDNEYLEKNEVSKRQIDCEVKEKGIDTEESWHRNVKNRSVLVAPVSTQSDDSNQMCVPNVYTKGICEEENQPSQAECSGASCRLQISVTSPPSPSDNCKRVSSQGHSLKNSFPSKHRTGPFQTLQHQEAYAVASSSTDEDTVGQERAADAYLFEGRGEEKTAGAKDPKDTLDQSNSESGACSEVTHLDREKQITISVMGSSESLTFHKIKNRESKWKVFQCPTCKMVFPWKFRDMCKHALEWPYMCTECGKVFKKLSKLNAHKITHVDDWSFKCGLCGENFKKKNHFAAHKRSHKEKPFKCSQCEKDFIRKYHFIKHMHLHCRQKPYVRGQCGKALCQSNE